MNSGTPRYLLAALLMTGAFCSGLPARAADSASSAASASVGETDLSGLWEVQIGTEAGAYASKLVMTRDGDGYKGKFTGADGQSFDLTGTVKGEGIEFRSDDGHVYTGKLAGGVLKGTYTQDGAEQSWTARRPKASTTSPGIAGRWKVSMGGPNGNTFEREMVITQTGDTFSGVLKAPANPPANPNGGNGGGRFRRDIEFKDATFKNDEFVFTTEFNGNNGQTIKRTYRATLKGDTLDGTIEGGQNARKWTATRSTDGAASGIAGSWKMTSEGRNGNTVERELILTQDGNTITGTLKAPTNLPAGAGVGGNGGGGAFRRDVEIKEATFTNNELKFVTELSFNNNTIRRTYTATLNGDTLQGTSVGTGGQGGQGGTPRKWKAVRGGASDGLAGVWDLTIHTGQQDYKAVVTINNDGGAWGGEYVTPGPSNSPELKSPLKPFTVDGKTVKFSIDLPLQLDGQTGLHVDFTGTQEGDTVKGDETSRFGTATWEMKKRGSSAAAPSAAGEWVLTLNTPNGTRTPTLVLVQNGEQWSGEMRSSNGSGALTLKNVAVDGNGIKFILPIPQESGQPVDVEFSGKFAGRMLTGSMKTSQGTELFSGERKEIAQTASTN